MGELRSVVRAAVQAGVIVVALGTAGVARGDLTGSYAGQLLIARKAQTAAAAGALTQSGRGLSGTVVLGMSDASLNGAYLVSGPMAGKHLRLVGANASGARLVWRGIATVDGVVGTARLRDPQGHLRGKLTLTRYTSTSTGTGCDAVFTQNQAFFTSQVMDQVLVSTCTACHVPGGQAQATRLQVMRGDPLATARSVALLVDAANPSASLILQKPLAAVPHGGGQQITPGSGAEQILRQWVDLVAGGQCVAPTGNTPAASLFAQNCAGCHGATGAGGAAGPDVRCAVRTLLADAVRRGRGQVMPALSLSGAELTTIATYLAENCSGQPRDVYAANCATCHGATAAGGHNADGVFGPNIRCSEGGDFGDVVRFGGEGMPAFPSLKGGQIAALARYVLGFCGNGGGGGG